MRAQRTNKANKQTAQAYCVYAFISNSEKSTNATLREWAACSRPPRGKQKTDAAGKQAENPRLALFLLARDAPQPETQKCCSRIKHNKSLLRVSIKTQTPHARSLARSRQPATNNSRRLPERRPPGRVCSRHDRRAGRAVSASSDSYITFESCVGAGCGQILRRAFGKIIVITAVNRISRARLEPPSGGCGERPKISFQRLQGICVILCQTTHINRNCCKDKFLEDLN